MINKRRNQIIQLLFRKKHKENKDVERRKERKDTRKWWIKREKEYGDKENNNSTLVYICPNNKVNKEHCF